MIDDTIQKLGNNEVSEILGGEYDPMEEIYGPSQICTCPRCGAQWKTYERMPVKHVCSEVRPKG